MEENIMLVVRSDALPEVYCKVLEAKKLLANERNITAGEASRRAGISRSAFYKYRDSVFSYSEFAQTGVGLSIMMLKDENGALSKVISAMSEMGINIITINQSVPALGVANVTVSFAYDHTFSKKDFIESISAIDSVVSVTVQ